MSTAKRRAAITKMMDEHAAAGNPFVFNKIISSITGPCDPIVLPRNVTQPDWELQSSVVIGRPARRAERTDVFDYVPGSVIANDVTARERIYRPDMRATGTDWLAGKYLPTFMPLALLLCRSPFVPNPQDVRTMLKLNGDTIQDEITSGIARLIECISERARNVCIAETE